MGYRLIMSAVKDIMIQKVVSVKDTDSIYQARMLLKDHGIRHVPVLHHETSDFCGLVTQRSLLNYTFNIIEKFGISGLEKREQRTPVSEIIETDCQTVSPDADLVSVGELFTDKKVSCLPVLENTRLKGIVTSVDFVKLALALLKA